MGYIILYIFLILVKGIDSANETIGETIATLLAIEGIGLIGYFFWLAYVKIPQQIDRDRKQRIKELESKKIIESKPEIVFYRRVYQRELLVENASAEQLMRYIKEGISGSLWYLHIDDKIAYDVDSSQTKFYDPQKDNAITHGIVFNGIKYDLEQKKSENGQRILNRKNGQKIPDLFYVSISSAGLGDKTKLLVRFDTDIRDACGFFDVMKKELNKIFVVKESATDWWMS